MESHAGIAAAQFIDPALKILGEGFDAPEARVLLLAIGLQESGFLYTSQLGGGPARGYWMFELNGVHGVLAHERAGPHAIELCRARSVNPSVAIVHVALMDDPVLAAGFARLLLFADPLPLPRLGEELSAWDCYARNWRPGRPRPAAWQENYHRAVQLAQTPPTVAPPDTGGVA